MNQIVLCISKDSDNLINTRTCVHDVERVYNLVVTFHHDELQFCTLSGFQDSKQQLAIACLLHWKLQQMNEIGTNVFVKNSVVGTCLSLTQLLNYDKMARETSQADGVRLLDAASFVDEVLVQEEDKQWQIADCREPMEFLGLARDKEVSGHLDGAMNVPFAAIFTTGNRNDPDKIKVDGVSTAEEGCCNGASLLTVEELRIVFETHDIDLRKPVVVVSSVPAEAAAIATALLLAGQGAGIVFCIDPVSDELVASLPSSYTTAIFKKGQLLYKDDKSQYDLSPQFDKVESAVKQAKVAELEKAYEEKLSEKVRKKRGKPVKEEQDEKAKEIVWIKDGRRFFDMPSPISKLEFLDASRAIFRMVSFVLAPFGFPASLRKKRSLQEVKIQCGSLFQDVIEVCSDLIYQQNGLNEGVMAMSLHKWVEENHDLDCIEQVKAINEIWEVLYTPPAVIEVPEFSEDQVLELATTLEQKIRELVGQRTPWAFLSIDEEESNDEEDFDRQGVVVDVEENECSDEESSKTDKVDEAFLDHDITSDDTNEQELRIKESGVDKAEIVGKEDIVFESESSSKVGEHDMEDEMPDKVDVNDGKATKTEQDSTETHVTSEKNDLNDNDWKAVDTRTASVKIGCSPDQERSECVDTRTDSWKHMYPSVVCSLGFIPQDLDANNKKRSTLQIKSLIQTVAEASWDVMKNETKELSQIEFQALCETLGSEKRDQLTDCVAEAEKSLYVLKHFLTRSLEADDCLADKLAGVREAVLDGDNCRRSGRNQVALAAYSKAFDYLPLYHKDLENAIVGRARCFLEMKELHRAKTEALIALKLNPYSAGAYECLGSVEEKFNHPEVAMQHYVTSFILDGSRSPELAELIDRVSRLVGRRVAKARFAEMEKMHELPSSWLVDSYFESFEHDIDHAVRVPFDIAKKEDMDPLDLDALTLLHRVIYYKRSKNYSEAQRDIRTLVSKDMESEGLSVENRALALNLHASLLYIAGDVHTALDVIDQSLVLEPALVNSLIKKGGFLAELGQIDEATVCFTLAMELDSNDADVYLHIGQMELLNGNFYEAVQCLRRCISRSDALPVIHVSYGMALYKSGSIYQANDLFKEAAIKFPESPEVHLFLGEVLADQGNYADAMRHFLKAWELSPQCPLPFLNAGRVYVSTNDPMRAIAHFKQALEVDPRCSSAHLDIAQVLFAQGRTTEAFQHFEVAASCCRFLPEVEEVCACQVMAKMQLKVTEILGVELRHILRSK